MTSRTKSTEPWDGELTGHVIAGRYELGGMFGAGGMADVYQARDTKLERTVAVKLFGSAATPEDHLRLAREAQMLSGLRCKGIVTVYDTGAHLGRPYYVMQAIGGGTLRHRMYEPLAPAVVARVGGQVAEILAHLHARGMVHRDVKPSNILLDDDERQAYLADFGLALQEHVTRVTGSGFLVGTAGYLAPEQLLGVEVSPAADVYGLGLVLLECLTGRAEYPGNNAEAALARLSRPPRIPADLPVPWREVLAAMTASDPARRPSAAQCAEMLLAAGEASRGVAPLPVVDVPRYDEITITHRIGSTAALRVGRRRVGVAMSGVAAAAAVATVLFALSGFGSEAPPATGEPGGSQRATVVGPVGDVSSAPATTSSTTTTTPPPPPPATVTVVQEVPAPAPQQAPPPAPQKKHKKEKDEGGGRNDES
jgi:hypothetical protein